MEGFCKHGECPSSEQLLAFVNGDAAASDRDYYTNHLSVCEFCAAETEFYRFFPPVEVTTRVEQMPEPLLELAEALLQKDHDLTPLYRLIDNGN